VGTESIILVQSSNAGSNHAPVRKAVIVILVVLQVGVIQELAESFVTFHIAAGE
jgi:hypothetical protein